MKRYLLLLVSLFVTMISYGQANIYVAVTSPDEPTKKELHYFEDVFHSELSATKKYRIRIGAPSSNDEFSKVRNSELYYNVTSDEVDPNQVKEFGKMMGVEQLCVVVVEKMSNGNYYFRAKIFDTETGLLYHSAYYPDAYMSKDTQVENLMDTRGLLKASKYLISKLEVGLSDVGTLNEAEETYNKQINKTALAWSIIPGVGLMQKGRTGEGVAYLLGDIALIGGGVGMLAYANKQQKIMNDRNTSYDQLMAANKNYKTANTASWCFFGAAAGLYVVNLFRAYHAEPKHGARLQWAVTPGYVASQEKSGTSNMSVNLALTYKF